LFSLKKKVELLVLASCLVGSRSVGRDCKADLASADKHGG
jgi:hypothetical protein